MADLFKDYIETLDKLDGVGKIVAISAVASYIDQLIQTYGLPADDAETVKLLKLTEQNWKFLSSMNLPPILMAYIKIICWECACGSQQPVTACLQSFFWGMAFGSTIEFST